MMNDIAHEWRVNSLLAEFYGKKKQETKTCMGCAYARGCDCILPFGAHKIVPSLTTRCVHYEEAADAKA